MSCDFLASQQPCAHSLMHVSALHRSDIPMCYWFLIYNHCFLKLPPRRGQTLSGISLISLSWKVFRQPPDQHIQQHFTAWSGGVGCWSQRNGETFECQRWQCQPCRHKHQRFVEISKWLGRLLVLWLPQAGPVHSKTELFFDVSQHGCLRPWISCARFDPCGFSFWADFMRGKELPSRVPLPVQPRMQTVRVAWLHNLSVTRCKNRRSLPPRA